ncbi:hypothetical protein, partial [Bacteroides heparinolyticus]
HIFYFNIICLFVNSLSVSSEVRLYSGATPYQRLPLFFSVSIYGADTELIRSDSFIDDKPLPLF